MPLSRRSHPNAPTLLRALVLAGVLALTACATTGPGAAGPGADATADDRPVVVTTFTVLADIARAVAGDDLEVRSLLRPGAEVHGYQPTPSDVRAAADADLVVDNGLGLEVWFERFLQDVDAPRVVASRDVEPIAITGDAYDGHPNPHAWMSPLTVVSYAQTLAEAFADLLPERAEDFHARAAAYAVELQEVHDELVAAVDALPADHRALVTCEGAFSYLARDAGLEERYIWPVNAERQATPQQVAGVIAFVQEREVPAVFCESTVSDAAMQQVVEATGARFGGVLYVDSLSEPDGPVPTYLDLVRHDVDVIVAGLSGTGLSGSGE